MKKWHKIAIAIVALIIVAAVTTELVEACNPWSTSCGAWGVDG